ncbi:hypothetical protein NON00_10860 [Roseomonas sp. GC11]|uniref:hypothetical protein n=1 Tax=Roseomonas sp. GC11 TaxID=2950546 RepID=UPI00210A7190|nr:hypothetical protein [Roseomonas sp. GC11]MCQ4160428.1 hypothetical protein [Roseomonas sp. GC11]
MNRAFPPRQRPRAALPDLIPSSHTTLRRVAGFALLGLSLWLVSVLALFRVIMRFFS